MFRQTNVTLLFIVVVVLGVTAALTSIWARSSGEPGVYTVTPSDADPAIRDFNEPTYVYADRGTSENAQLVLFLSGTKGKPRDRPLLRTVSDLGYRIIDLTYNDDLSVNPICPRDPAPDCSEHFRSDRVYGDGKSSFVHTPAAETIVNRLAKTLQYLDQHYPNDHWGAYLANGEPDWSRIVVSGLSQGAGMAAYIAKHQAVARVVLFSSPADFVFDDSRPDRSRPADWLSQPSSTPAERWYAEYHAREKGAARLQDAYAALGIPADHVSVFDLDLPSGREPAGENPFHGSTIRNTGYKSDWEHMFGTSPQ